jgi:hypothetical protein
MAKPKIELHFNGSRWWARMFYHDGEEPWCYWPKMLEADPAPLIAELSRYAATLGKGANDG